MAATPPTGQELWAAAKFIGRECSTVNKDFFLCKKHQGDHPAVCEGQSKLASLCASRVISTLNQSFPAEYKAFRSCLDTNDHRYADCRKQEGALIDCWNVKHGLVSKHEG